MRSTMTGFERTVSAALRDDVEEVRKMFDTFDTETLLASNRMELVWRMFVSKQTINLQIREETR